MAGQPNRRARSEVPPTDPHGRARPVGGGVPGSHEIDAFWEPTDDIRVANDRLRRYKAVVEKAKADRREMREALKLKTEEAYNEGLLAVAPQLLEIDKKITEITNTLLKSSIGEDELKLLKALLPELSKQRDRLYGKTRQRMQSSHLSATVDINKLHEQGRQRELERGASRDPEADGEVLDAEVEDAEVIDE